VSLARLSLYYLATYLLGTGVAFVLSPAWALHVLMAERAYDDAFVRFVGAFMIALGTIVTQIIRLRLDVLHRTTVGIRVFFVALITYLYISTRDVLFIAILGVVTVGVVLTVTGLVLDHRRRPPGVVRPSSALR
jgi:hypothetical protein